MDTSLAGERCDAAATLSSDSFFFMSPYRSFTTRGCFMRLETPAADGAARRSVRRHRLARWRGPAAAVSPLAVEPVVGVGGPTG